MSLLRAYAISCPRCSCKCVTVAIHVARTVVFRLEFFGGDSSIRSGLSFIACFRNANDFDSSARICSRLRARASNAATVLLSRPSMPVSGGPRRPSTRGGSSCLPRCAPGSRPWNERPSKVASRTPSAGWPWRADDLCLDRRNIANEVAHDTLAVLCLQRRCDGEEGGKHRKDASRHAHDGTSGSGSL